MGNANSDYKKLLKQAKDLESEIKSLKSQLIEKKKLFQSLFIDSHSIELIIEFKTGKIIDANKTACIFYGYTHDEFTKLTIFAINTLSKNEISQEMHKAELGNKNHFKFRHKLKNGKIKDVEVYSGKIEINRKTYLLSMILDVSERNSKQIELEDAKNRIRDCDEKFKIVFEEGLAAIIIADDNGNYLDANKAAAELTGYSIPELKQLNVKDIQTTLNPDAKKRYKNYLKKGYDTGEFDFITKDGEKKVAIYRAIRVKPEFNVSMLFDITKRKNAEEKLKLSEEKHRNLFNFLEDGFLRADKKGIITMANLAVAKICGYKFPEEMIGLDMKKLYKDPGERDKMISLLKANEVVKNYELRFVTKQNKTIWTSSNIKFLRDSDNNIIGTEGLIRDISELKKAQIDLNERIKELESIFQLSVIADDMSKSLDTILNEIVQIIPPSMQFPDICEARIKYNDKIYQTNGFKETEHKLEKAIQLEGNLIGMLTIIYREKPTLMNGEHIFYKEEERLMVIMAERISKIITRIDFKNKLIQSNARYKRLVDNSSSLILEFDADTYKIINYNPAIINFFNPKHKNLIGKHIKYLLPLDVIDKSIPLIEKAFKENELQKFEGEINGKYFLHNYIPINNHKEYSVLSISYDITDLKEAEILRKSEAQLRELNATKDKFFSIISHDLKNPFNAILGFAGLLEDNLNNYNPDKIKALVSRISSSSKNAYSLLQNLLEWSRTQTGNINFEPENLIAEKIVLDVINQIANTAEIKKISVDYTVDDAAIVYADKYMLHTVLRNLIYNAIKFTPNGGHIYVQIVQNENETKFIIQDNGVGMNQEKLNKLFKVDEKVNSLGTNKETGTGLGLLICKEFVEKHGGKIGMESEVGKGSTFYFTINQKN